MIVENLLKAVLMCHVYELEVFVKKNTYMSTYYMHPMFCAGHLLHPVISGEMRDQKEWIIIIIIIKRGWQCKAGRERLTPYQSEDPNPTTPTHRKKEEKIITV